MPGLLATESRGLREALRDSFRKNKKEIDKYSHFSDFYFQNHYQFILFVLAHPLLNKLPGGSRWIVKNVPE